MAAPLRFNCNSLGFFRFLTCLLFAFIFSIQQPSAHAAPSTPKCSATQASYDFIVIGGGTAGLALATRLSQRLPQICILVIEAGPDGRAAPGIYTPGKKGSTFGSIYDWNLTTIPQPNIAGRVVKMTRGHVLGGSSALNLMTWDRASVADYDAWEALGNQGWNFKNMYRSMLKVENFAPSPEYGQNGVAQGGPVQTLINRILPAHQLAFPPTMEILGLPANHESLDGNPIGVSRQPSNIRLEDYTRSYSAAYLDHANSNLILKLSSRVTKINFKGKTASGVTLDDGTVLVATKEVILSAGSLQSPQILELSGIGDKAILAAAGVKTLYHLPGVGENLQDHIRIQNSYQLKNGSLSFDRLRYNTTFVAEQQALYDEKLPSEYDYTGSGYAYLPWSTVSSSTAASLLALAKQSVNRSSRPSLKTQLGYLTDKKLSESVPQLELIFSDGYTGVKGYPAVGTPLYGAEFFTIIAGVQHPFARGSVHISTSSILNQSTIDPGYLSTPYDLAAIVAAAKYARKVASTAPLSTWWTSEYEPGPAVQTDADWESYARNCTLSIYHPVGTCGMLAEAEGGVVNPELKVYGVKGLRVVDASIMPVLISAHMQTAVYGIAEMAADMIVRDWY